MVAMNPASPAPLAPAAITRFALAGDAVFTLVNRSTGGRFTFRLRKNAKAEGPTYFAEVLTGSDNTRDYSYLGCIFGKGPEARYAHGKKSRIGQDAPSAKAFEWFARNLTTGKIGESKVLAVHHEGRCGRCGRALTVPESVESGLGPICAGKES
jgi:hypothetical protein